MTTTRKIDIGLHLSRNYDKIVLELKDEPVEYESEEEFSAKVRRLFSILKKEVDLEFEKIQK